MAFLDLEGRIFDGPLRHAAETALVKTGK